MSTIGDDPSIPSGPWIIDTSVALKWYLPEPGHTEALRYMDRGIDRHAPDLLPLEGSHALLKRTRSSDPAVRLAVDDASLVVEALRTSAPIIYHPCGPLLASAFALAVEIGASTYDGLFLALALLLDGTLVTADRKLFDKIRAGPHHARARWFLDPP